MKCEFFGILIILLKTFQNFTLLKNKNPINSTFEINYRKKNYLLQSNSTTTSTSTDNSINTISLILIVAGSTFLIISIIIVVICFCKKKPEETQEFNIEIVIDDESKKSSISKKSEIESEKQIVKTQSDKNSFSDISKIKIGNDQFKKDLSNTDRRLLDISARPTEGKYNS